MVKKIDIGFDNIDTIIHIADVHIRNLKRHKEYRQVFRKLYKDWRKDYKKVSRYYFVQVRAGCGSPTLEFLEVQRQFEFTLSNLKVISANGLNAHDGCHYGFNNGYKQLLVLTCL